ncbi:hypothetical protein PIB30_089092 [Stylosanthes scabra]|uniref:Retrotransposon gag domain-containing protein n=1 Tax=Stylosanthes scabra TaxID=79078 RepID=A0ABU6UXL7_9FABA|nr:hypothetical protein [Stylosanthes scabra]
MMEEIQKRSHDYLQQEEGQTAVKTDRNKKDNPRKEHVREDRGRKEHRSNRLYYNPLSVSMTQFLNEVSQVEKVLTPRPIKNTHRGDRHSYCKYHKQHGHDTEECRDLLDFFEQGLKNGKFREYMSRYRHRDEERSVRQRPNSLEAKTEKRKDEPKERSTHHEIPMISGGIPEEGKPPSKKAAKRSRHSCLAVEVMPRILARKPPPDNQGSSADILFRRCFDALELTESDLETHSDDLVGFSGEREKMDKGSLRSKKRSFGAILTWAFQFKHQCLGVDKPCPSSCLGASTNA